MTVAAEPEIRARCEAREIAAVCEMQAAWSVASDEESGGRESSSKLVRWLKFNFVGGIGVVVQFAALFLLKGVFRFEYLLATVIAVEAAVVHNFVWHEQFTWADRLSADRAPVDGERASDRIRMPLRKSLRRLIRFQLANGAVSLLGNLALMKVMVGLGHMNYLVANAIAIVLCSMANFLVSDEWVFGNTH